MDIPFYHDDVLSALAATAGAAPPPPSSSTSSGAGGGGGGGPFPDGARGKKAGLAALALGEPAGKAAPAPARPPEKEGGEAEGGEGPPALLSSPDLGLLKLASPELERLIIQSNGLVTTTPTSGGGGGGGGAQFLFPKGGGGGAPTDEQEFAAGFVKALEHLHHQNQLGPVGGELPPQPASSSSAPAAAAADPPPVYANLSTYGGGGGGGGGAYAGAAEGATYHPRLQPPPLKDEPQIVPEVASFGGGGGGVPSGESPPLSPIDMDTQERIKAERKRLRNRIAASKCRRRKLERISRLEEKVKSLKSQNTELASTANLLREQVAQLKQKVLSHVNSGCQLLPQQQQQGGPQAQQPPPPHQVPAY